MISSDPKVTGPTLLAWGFEDSIKKIEGFHEDFCGPCLIEVSP